ncbi:MAG: beta-lactamase family protein [Chloroflexota bacterium]|nr:beta-lactamase family protein [Chloroflexota bacterium]
MTRERTTEPFSGVISLRHSHAIVFERAYGAALRSEAIPNQVDTRFQIASGCKIFTSVAICQLIERGVLSPNTLLTDCVDARFPQFDPNITIHQLLTHTSGIPDYFDEAVMSDYEALWLHQPMYAMRRPADFLPLFQNQPMRSPAGASFAYNNAGSVLLGLIIEQRTATPFTDYVTEHIFRLCGMHDSGYFAADQLPSRTALAYIENADGTWRSNIYAIPIIGGADGGAYTTAADMARFWQALQEHRLLSSESTTRLLTPQIATQRAAPYSHYGYGVWMESSANGVRKCFVEGSDPGVAFRSGIYPDQNVTLTLLGNTGRTLWSVYTDLEAMLSL